MGTSRLRSRLMYLRISCFTASRTRSRFLPSMLSWNVFFMRDGNALGLHVDVIERPGAQREALVDRLGRHVGETIGVIDGPERPQSAQRHRLSVQVERDDEAVLPGIRN